MRTLTGFVIALACGVAVAQAPMYRSTMPDGKKVVSDRPMPGATKVEEIKMGPGNYAPGSPVKGDVSAPASRQGALVAAEAELQRAQKDYDGAVAKAEAGRVEREGDRIGTAKGGARLSEAYEKRQEMLKAEVDAARAQLDAARRKFNEAR